MQFSLHLILISCHIVAFSTSIPVPHRHESKSPCTRGFTQLYPSYERYMSMVKSKPIGRQAAKAPRLRSRLGCPKYRARPVHAKLTSHSRHIKPIVTRTHPKLRRAPKMDDPKKSNSKAIGKKSCQRRNINLDHMRRIIPDSPLAGLFASLSSPLSSLPVIGAPLSSLLSSLPTNAITSPGAVSGLLGTLTGAAQSAPVLGDIIKLLPLSALLKGNLIDNVKGALSGLLVAIPVLGGPLDGLSTAASGAASALPISLVDMRAVSPINAQRTVTKSTKSHPEDEATNPVY